MTKAIVMFGAMLGILAIPAVAQDTKMFPDYDLMEKAELEQVLVQLREDLLVGMSKTEEARNAIESAKIAYNEASGAEKPAALRLLAQAMVDLTTSQALEHEYQKAEERYGLLLGRERLLEIAAKYQRDGNAQEPTLGVQWEYLVWDFGLQPDTTTGSMAKMLSAYGSKGWELVTVREDGRCVFKRQKLGNPSSSERK